jgi:hypothetical protein
MKLSKAFLATTENISRGNWQISDVKMLIRPTYEKLKIFTHEI